MNTLAKLIGIILLIPIALVLVALAIITLIGSYIGLLISLAGDIIWVVVGIVAIVFIVKIIKSFFGR